MKTTLITATISVLLLIITIIAFITGGSLMVETRMSTVVTAHSTSLNSTKHSGPHRKLLLHNNEGGAEVVVQPARIWGDRCSNADIVINQGPTAPLPSGIPTYTVEIMNVCTTGCDISGIHLSCGWFSSARLINPRLFKRLRYNDCLVNEGKALLNGHTISFQYANTFAYPLAISSVIC